MAKKKKIETVEDILDRIEEDINLIREKCVCNGDEDYASEDDSDEDSFDDTDEDWVPDSDED
jgi:hypothetical protein